jgi:hypothetical protein
MTHQPGKLLAACRSQSKARLSARRATTGPLKFTEGHELPDKWKVAKEMVGRLLSQQEAKRLLAQLE